VNTSPWYNDPNIDNSDIISSRIRLARNVQGFPFLRNLTRQSATELVNKVHKAAEQFSDKQFFHKIIPQELGDTTQQVFLEKHILSPHFLHNPLPKGLLVSEDTNISVMINEEDHIRIQVMKPNNRLFDTWDTAAELDHFLEAHIDFSFDKELGYLTACPTNVGTGLRASFMMHLPCLEDAGAIEKLHEHLRTRGATIRGLYGEGSAPLGSIYQVSNQVTLGKDENTILQDLDTTAFEITELEQQTRDKIMATRRHFLQDRAYRAYATVSHCRVICVKEAMQLLSDIRLGFAENVLEMPKPDKPIYQIMMEIQPGHLHRMARNILNEENTKISRANYLRDTFQN